MSVKSECHSKYNFSFLLSSLIEEEQLRKRIKLVLFFKPKIQVQIYSAYLRLCAHLHIRFFTCKLEIMPDKAILCVVVMLCWPQVLAKFQSCI